MTMLCFPNVSVNVNVISQEIINDLEINIFRVKIKRTGIKPNVKNKMKTSSLALNFAQILITKCTQLHEPPSRPGK